MGLRPGLKPDQKQQKLCFKLLLWGTPPDPLSFFEAAPPLSKDEGAAGVVAVVGSSTQTPSISSWVLSVAEEEVLEEPCTKSPQPASRKASPLITKYESTSKSVRSNPPSSCGSSKTLHIKLGSHKRRPLGFGNCSGVSLRFRGCSSPVISSSTSLSLEGEFRSYRSGNSANATERSCSCGFPRGHTTGFCEHHFSRPPKKGWSEACSEPRFKSVSLLRTFQNGGHSYVKGPVKEKRLYGQDRPEGCLFHSAHMEEPPKISEVHLEKDNVRVCSPSLRHVKRSQGIHKAYEASRRPSKTTGYQAHHLFRRHPDYGSVPRPRPSTRLDYPKPSRRIRLHGKLSKVSASPCDNNGVSRF